MSPDDEHPPRRRPVGADLLLGVAAAVIGLFPWLVTGFRLPLQNLWAVETTAEAMPRSLLPLSQYHLLLISAMLVTGGAMAALAVRLARRWWAPRRWLVCGALVVAQVVALTQAATVLAGGLEQSHRAGVYLSAVMGTAAVSIATGLLVAVLMTARARAAVVVGAAVAAVLVVSWVAALIVPPGSAALAPDVVLPALPWAAPVLPWVAPVLVGVAIGWAGVGSLGRASAAVVALAALWIGPAAVTAIASATGSRVLARDPAEMAAYAGEVFVAAMLQPTLTLRALGAAIAVAALILVARRLSRPRTSAPS